MAQHNNLTLTFKTVCGYLRVRLTLHRFKHRLQVYNVYGFPNRIRFLTFIHLYGREKYFKRSENTMVGKSPSLNSQNCDL